MQLEESTSAPGAEALPLEIEQLTSDHIIRAAMTSLGQPIAQHIKASYAALKAHLKSYTNTLATASQSYDISPPDTSIACDAGW
jgi:hypothetical protein